MGRRLRLSTMIALVGATAIWAGLEAGPYDIHAQGAQAPAFDFAQGKEASALRTSEFAGLRLRNIGPANMSGRFVDMDVVESDPYVI